MQKNKINTTSITIKIIYNNLGSTCYNAVNNQTTNNY